MAFVDLLRNGVATADRLTKSLQPKVTHRRWKGTQLTTGEKDMHKPVKRQAIVEWKQQLVKTWDGTQAVSKCHIVFLSPVPVGQHDELVMPDGTTGPILALGGFEDAGTGEPMFKEAWIG